MPVPWLQADDPLPPTHRALGAQTPLAGLLAAGGGLAPARLRAAYSQGVFPWYSPGQPVLWWAPDPRMVLRTADFRLSHSLRKTLRRFLRTPGCEIRFDHDTPAVIAACAGTPREGQRGTWIVPEMVAAYGRWSREGPVHSVSTWIDGVMVGGLYGVSLGRMFFGESMFSHRTDASKIALAALVAYCRANAMPLIDCQQETGHLASVGAAPMPRAAVEAELIVLVAREPPLRWAYHSGLWRTLGLPGCADAASESPAPTAAPAPAPTSP